VALREFTRDDDPTRAPTGPASVESDLRSPDPWARLRAVQRLRADKHPQTARLLVERLDDADELVRTAAGEELAALGDRSRIREILDRFDGPYPRPAALALAAVATEQDDGVLSRMFNSPDPILRRCGIQALARAGELRWRRNRVFIYGGEFRKALADPDEGVRITAARALKKYAPHVEALKLMDAALGHEDPRVRRTAAIEVVAFASDATPLLEKRAGEPEPSVREAVEATLRRLRARS